MQLVFTAKTVLPFVALNVVKQYQALFSLFIGLIYFILVDAFKIWKTSVCLHFSNELCLELHRHMYHL